MNYISLWWLCVQITEQKTGNDVSEFMLSTGLHCLTIQVLNTRVYFRDIWYTHLTSVHYNGYTTSFVKV